MQSYRNSDVQLFQHTVYHTDNGFVSGHVFARAFGYAQDDRRFALFCC